MAEDNHPMPGGYAKMAINAQNVTDVADFAIEDQKTLMKAAGKSDAITLVKIVEAERAVVAGFNYRLKIQVKTDQTTTVVSIIVYEGVTGEHKKKLTSWKDVAE